MLFTYNKGTAARWALTHTIEILKFTTAILKTNSNSITKACIYALFAKVKEVEY